MTRHSDPGRDWFIILVIAVAFFVILNIISFVWFPFLPWFEERQAGEEVIRDTYDADKAVQEYEWFRTQYHEIQEQRAKIENAYDAEEQFHETYGDDPSGWSRQAETRHGRLHTRITGNQNQLENLVSDYNARSDMDNRALFKCHLPYQVDERFAIRGPPGSDQADQPQDQYVEGADGSKEPPAPEECDALPSQVEQGS